MFTVIYSTGSYLEINAHTQGDMLICRFIHVVLLLGGDSMERYVECWNVFFLHVQITNQERAHFSGSSLKSVFYSACSSELFLLEVHVNEIIIILHTHFKKIQWTGKSLMLRILGNGNINFPGEICAKTGTVTFRQRTQNTSGLLWTVSNPPPLPTFPPPPPTSTTNLIIVIFFSPSN